MSARGDVATPVSFEEGTIVLVDDEPRVLEKRLERIETYQTA